MQRTFERRQFLAGLLAATVVLTAGCASFRSTSELEAAAEDLDALLEALEASNESDLLALGESIKQQALGIQQAHTEFAESFNEAAMVRATTDEALEALVDGYEIRRKAARQALLEAQDALHAEIPTEAWPEVLEVLNRKAVAVASPSGAGR